MTFKQLREAAGYTQERLAEVADVQQTTVSQIELGKVRSPQYATVAKLAKALSMTTDAVAEAIEKTEAA